MRVVVFFLYLIFLNLTGSGNYLRAETGSGTHFDIETNLFSKNEQVKLPVSHHASIIIGDADVDIEEECLNDDERADKNSGSFNIYKDFAPGNSSLACSYLFPLDYFRYNLMVSPPIYGKSNPIYITNRVLRL